MAMPGTLTGRMTLKNVAREDAPSTQAASSSETGTDWKNPIIIQITKGILVAAKTITSAMRVSYRPTLVIIR